MEIKQTLLMGKTGFEMKGNLAQKEPLILKKWQEDKVYEELLEKNKNSQDFMLHDGPPYANGDMHCGHMLNKILKDIILRQKAMSGYKTYFIPGWDTHGLPIENAVTKAGVNRKTTPIVEFRKKCEEFAYKQVARQEAQIKRLGILADFDNKYITLTKDFEKSQIHVFAQMALDGLIYKGLKPVFYSPSSESALAIAEIEYKDVEAKTIYVKFQVTDGKGLLSSSDYFVIWTTTPWTMPGDLAISVNPYMDYGLFKTEKGNLVFLKELKDSLKETLGLEQCEEIKSFKGQELEFMKVKHPMYDRESLIVVGTHVTADAGTGCVHTAPGFGEDDFNVCMKYDIPPYCPVDGRGMMDETCGDELKGLFYEEANEKVITMLEEEGALLKMIPITHSYPHDWRTHKPVIFRATPQWFCSIDKIREKTLEQIDQVNWTPEWGKTRMHNMIADRGDWCISRQRVWGLPIPIIYNEDGTPIMEKEVFDRIEELVGQYGSSIWYEMDVKDILPKGYTNPASPNGEFKKEKDIMDVWFDSGSSFNGVIRQRGLKYPVDLYLEGSDQYRGWFNSSLLISVALYGIAPYKAVLSHGFILDEKGNKMSKSLGNGVDPNKIINIYGVDVLRLWCATVDYQSDVRISENLIKKVSETYRKIRNTFKFLLGNLSDGDTSYNNDTDHVTSFNKVSTYVLASLEQTKNLVLDYYDKYDFANAMSTLLNFMTSDVSAFFASIAKDTLYCDKKNSPRRREVQTVIYQIVEDLSRLFAPVLCFTMDEVYQNIPGHLKSHIVLEDMPKRTKVFSDDILKEFALFKQVRQDVMKALEEARSNQVIGSSQEAYVKIFIKDEKTREIFNKFTKEELRLIFIVSDVELVSSSVGNDYEVTSTLVEHHTGCKCERCWNFFSSLEEVEGFKVCSRCKEVLING